MLQKLTVKNYAIIQEIDIPFSSSLTIITGETGAGKSILLGALSLVLGDRANTNSLFDKERKCVIEAEFDLQAYNLPSFFETHELDYDDLTIIRREITPSGKSRAFINDTPVNLTVLRELSAQLINVHSQHQTLELNDKTFQLSVLDHLADNGQLLEQYKRKYDHYRQQEKKLQELREQNRKAQQDFDYYQFQLNELDELPWEELNQEELENELSILNNAEEIKSNLASVTQLLSNEDTSAGNRLREASTLLSDLIHYNRDLEDFHQRLESSLIEVEDIASEMERIQDQTDYDPQRAEQLNERLNELYRLEKKHGVNTVEELRSIRDEIEKKVQQADTLGEEIERLQEELNATKEELSELAQKLHTSRQKQVPVLQEKVQKMVADMGMPHAKLEADLEKTEVFGQQGIDQVTYRFAANKGSELQELKKIASGGELSRLMLSLKSLIAESASMPTLIFDEIDTGISGDIAGKVGNILARLGQSHQVICITHMPQIAVKGDTHFYVYKETSDEKTNASIRKLEGDERIKEVAKMLSGDNVSEAALQNARELLLN